VSPLPWPRAPPPTTEAEHCQVVGFTAFDFEHVVRPALPALPGRVPARWLADRGQASADFCWPTLTTPFGPGSSATSMKRPFEGEGAQCIRLSP
jgi:hypothetical protein